MASQNVTYQKVWNENETQREGRDGRIRSGVVGWVYEVRINGEHADNFDSVRAVKRAYPSAVRRGTDN